VVYLFLQKIVDPQFMAMLLTAIAAAAAALTIALPYLEKEQLQSRMRSVAIERERIRNEAREQLARSGGGDAKLRGESKAYMKKLVEDLDLHRWLGTEDARHKLTMAGYRGQQAEYAFLFFRFVAPIGMFFVTAFYVFFVAKLEQSFMVKVGMTIGGAFLGMKGPELFISNQISKRQLNMKRAFPDSLDLMLICVESGMSIEQAFRKVAQEIGPSSIPMAEELALTAAEMSYLPERRQAFENLALRTGLDSIKSVTTALAQAERYGTPLGTALRVLSQESRDQRMTDAEKKAASLPPKLTVPMIIFFLPVLFVVIMMPAVIGSMGLD
jgi:tight adherence protein C